MERATKRIATWMTLFAFAFVALLALPCEGFAASASVGGAPLGVNPNVFTNSSEDKEISLTVRYELEENAGFVRGAMISLYKVADVLPDGSLRPVDELADLPVNWNVASASDARVLADTIEAYLMYSDALRGVPYETGEDGSGVSNEFALLEPVDVALTDINGVASFPCEAEEITAGCYLVMATSIRDGVSFTEVSPSMLVLPYSYESGEVDYSPIVSLKARTFALSGTVTVDVSKVWKVDEGSSVAVEAEARPAEVTAMLLCDSVIYDSVKLNVANGWQYSWVNLPAGHQWSVVEKEVPDGYTVSLVKDGTSVTIVNTCVLEPEEPEEPGKPDASTPQDPNKKPSQKLPQTGQLWWPVPLLFTLGILFIGIGIAGRRRRG